MNSQPRPFPAAGIGTQMRRKKEGGFDRIDEKQELIPPKIVRRQLPSRFPACQHSNQLQPSQRDILNEKHSTERVVSRHSSSLNLIIPLFFLVDTSSAHHDRLHDGLGEEEGEEEDRLRNGSSMDGLPYETA